MKKKASIFLFFSLFASAVCAQEYYEPDTIVIEKKNTIGLYINPAVNLMMTSTAPNPRFGLQYKHLLANYKRLRISAVYDKIHYEHSLRDYTSIDDLLEITDSTFTFLNESRNLQKATLRFGLEWSDYTRPVESFFGFDILAGYRQDRYNLEYNLYQYENPDWNGDFSYHQLNSRLPQAYTYHFLELGIASFFGWRFDIRDHFELAVSVSPEVTVALPVSYEWRGDSRIPDGGLPDTEIEFRLRVLEMVLSYRF